MQKRSSHQNLDQELHFTVNLDCLKVHQKQASKRAYGNTKRHDEGNNHDKTWKKEEHKKPERKNENYKCQSPVLLPYTHRSFFHFLTQHIGPSKRAPTKKARDGQHGN